MSEWIKIIEKMPRHEEFVLAYNRFNIPIVLQFLSVTTLKKQKYGFSKH